jgi:hypothetical protein
MCALFLADPEFNDFCSQTCLDGFYQYVGDLDDFYIQDHMTAWSEL